MRFNIPYKFIRQEDEIAINKNIAMFYYTIAKLPESYTTINKRKELIDEWEPIDLILSMSSI
jgi:hypothetical protein